VTSLRLALGVFHRLLAPFLPFVTDEAWSWYRDGSVHSAQWPLPTDLPAPHGADANQLLTQSSWVLGEIRRAKTEAKRSMRAPVERVVVQCSAEAIELIALVAHDLREAGSVAEMVLEASAGEPTVSVTLAAE